MAKHKKKSMAKHQRKKRKKKEAKMMKDNDQKDTEKVCCLIWDNHASFFPWCILKERIVGDCDSCEWGAEKNEQISHVK